MRWILGCEFRRDRACRRNVQTSLYRVVSFLIEDWKHTLYLWRQNRLAMIGTILVAFFIVIAIFAPAIAPYDPIEINISRSLLPPSSDHIFKYGSVRKGYLQQSRIRSSHRGWYYFACNRYQRNDRVAVGITAGYLVHYR